MKSVGLQAYEAINDPDIARVKNLAADYPDQLNEPKYVGSQTWLAYACQIGRLDVVKALLALGADPNTRDAVYGCKALCRACASGYYEIAKVLLDSNSDMDTDLSVRNPLFAAIVARSPDIVRLLLERGIDPTVRYNSDTMKDMDAVAFALMQGEQECAEMIALWNSSGDRKASAKALGEAAVIAESVAASNAATAGEEDEEGDA